MSWKKEEKKNQREMLRNQLKKGEETKRSFRIKLKRDREEDEEEEGR